MKLRATGQRGARARSPIALDFCASRYLDRDHALAEAYRTGAYSMQAIADHFGVSRMTVSRAVKSREGEHSARDASRAL